MTSIFKANEVSSSGLVQYIQQLGSDLVGCELGVCRGNNLRYLLDLAPVNRYVYAIDPWAPYQDWNGYIPESLINQYKHEAIRNLLPYDDIVKVLEMTSKSALKVIADDELDWIFIDGAHDYDSVYFDCVHYWTKVRAGGLFSGHDYQLPDVKKAVHDFRDNFSITATLQFTDTDVWFWYK